MRYHYMDTGRAAFMLLGIPFHASLIYGGNWVITASEYNAFAFAIGQFLKTFRMPAFFVIAGFFAAMILSRRNRFDCLRGRFLALWVPFSIGVVFNQSGATSLARGDPLADVYDDPRALVQHLWFLASLFWMCCGLTLIWPLITRLIASPGWETGIKRYGPPMIVGMFLWLWIGLPVFQSLSLGHLNHNFIGARKIAQYLPFYMVGVLYYYSEIAEQWILSPSRLENIIALAAPLAFVACKLWQPTVPIAVFFQALAAIFTTRSVFTLLHSVGDKENPWIRDISNKSFSIYVFHQPVIVVLAAMSLELAIPEFAKFLGIIVLTAAISFALATLVDKSPVMRFLLNGIPFWKRVPVGIKGPAAR